MRDRNGSFIHSPMEDTRLWRCYTNHFCSKRLIGLLFRYMFLLLTLRILSLWCRDLARTGLYGTIHSSLYYGGAHWYWRIPGARELEGDVNLHVTNKVKTFLWKIVHGCLPLWENLHYKGVDCPLDCLQWDRGIEDVWHCFGCCDARNVWEELRATLDRCHVGRWWWGSDNSV